MEATGGQRKRPKRIWRALGWVLVLLTVAGIAAYYLFAERVRYIFAGVEVYNGIGFHPRLYASDHDGMYPPMSSETGRLMYSPDIVTRDDMYMLTTFRFPGEPDADVSVTDDMSDEEFRRVVERAVNDDNYYYLGYAVTNEVEGRAFLRAYAETIDRGGDFESDLIVPMGEGNFGGDRLYRLRERDEFQELLGKTEIEIERFMGQAPMIILNPRKRARAYFPPPIRSEGLIFFANGVGATPAVPGEFPYTEEFFGALEKLDGMTAYGSGRELSPD